MQLLLIQLAMKAVAAAAEIVALRVMPGRFAVEVSKDRFRSAAFG